MKSSCVYCRPVTSLRVVLVKTGAHIAAEELVLLFLPDDDAGAAS
ncbi:hypothetical protein SRABI83_00889 [Arthrobacter sp. Bi83]|nr:hypothetical protein [Arthrobacter sp. Bi83]CAH0158496.1 hypothetical protein SRABI83_00889 [Arthrobacter sp. Bi83]